MGRKGAEKTNAMKRARKTLREELCALLADDVKIKGGGSMNAQVAMSTALLQAAIKGNVRAYEVIRDTIGEKPVENVALTTGSFDALEQAFAALKDDAE